MPSAPVPEEDQCRSTWSWWPRTARHCWCCQYESGEPYASFWSRLSRTVAGQALELDLHKATILKLRSGGERLSLTLRRCLPLAYHFGAQCQVREGQIGVFTYFTGAAGPRASGAMARGFRLGAILGIATMAQTLDPSVSS